MNRLVDGGGRPMTFTDAHMGLPPDGPFRGEVKGWPAIARVWQGKVFDAKAGTVVNKLMGRQAVSGRVTVGTSQLDGQPCYVIRYPVLPLVHDELRHMDADRLVGVMLSGRRVIARFTLERD